MKSPRRSSTISLPDAVQGVADVEFSNAAVADLVDIDEFGAAQFGDDIAEIYMRGFDEGFAMLRDFPKAAPLQTVLGKDIRCLMHRQHRILYQVKNDAVLVLRVIHHAMDTRQALQGSAGR